MSRLYFRFRKFITASSIWLPAMRTDREYTMPLSEITAMSVVPPPISTTMLPPGSVIGSPAPIAATIACSTRCTSLAFARYADHDARMHHHLPAMGLLDEVVQHLLGLLEVGNHAILHRLDRDDVARRA